MKKLGATRMSKNLLARIIIFYRMILSLEKTLLYAHKHVLVSLKNWILEG